MGLTPSFIPKVKLDILEKKFEDIKKYGLNFTKDYYVQLEKKLIQAREQGNEKYKEVKDQNAETVKEMMSDFARKYTIFRQEFFKALTYEKRK